MKNFLRSLLSTLLLFAAGTLWADDYAYLTITSDGADQSYEVSQISKITFDTDDMVLHLTGGDTARLPLAGLGRMFFAAQPSSGIATLNADSGSSISLRDGVLRVNAAKPTTLYIYNVSGQIVFTEGVGAGQTELNIGQLHQGVYIVKLGSETKKIMGR